MAQMTGDQPHHLDRESLLAIIIVPAVVGSIILLSFCAWVCRQKNRQNSDLKVAKSSGMLFSLFFRSVRIYVK